MKQLFIVILVFSFQQIIADSLNVSGYKQIQNSITGTQYPRYDANNNLYGKSPKIINGLSISTHNIEIKKEGITTINKQIEITDNDRTEVNVGLTNLEENNSIQKEITITSNPSGASLVLNVKKEGETLKTLVASLGENEIELSKTGHIKHKSRFKVTEQKYKYDFTLSHGNNEGDQLDFKKYKKRKNLWLGGTIVSAGIGAYYLYSANSHYKEYQTATDNATDLHNQTKTEGTIWPIAFGVSGFCAVMTIINGSKQRKAKKQIGITVVPVEGGGMLSIKLNL